MANLNAEERAPEIKWVGKKVSYAYNSDALSACRNGKHFEGEGLVTDIDDGGIVIDAHLRIRTAEVVKVTGYNRTLRAMARTGDFSKYDDWLRRFLKAS